MFTLISSLLTTFLGGCCWCRGSFGRSWCSLCWGSWGSSLGWCSGFSGSGGLSWGSGSFGWSSGLGWGSGGLSWSCGLGWGSRSSTLLRSGSNSFSDFSFISGLLLLKEFRKKFFISNVSFLRCFPGFSFTLLVEDLSSKSLFGNQSLDFSGFVESLITLDKGTTDNIFSNIILGTKSESSLDGTSSLGTKSSWFLSIGKSSNFSGALNKNLKCNNSKIRSANASSD
jgi:hypothetical protein